MSVWNVCREVIPLIHSNQWACADNCVDVVDQLLIGMGVNFDLGEAGIVGQGRRSRSNAKILVF